MEGGMERYREEGRDGDRKGGEVGRDEAFEYHKLPADWV